MKCWVLLILTCLVSSCVAGYRNYNQYFPSSYISRYAYGECVEVEDACCGVQHIHRRFGNREIQMLRFREVALNIIKYIKPQG
ncbi:UNVERIFIED_CONTAM: hypothetical protein NCL1_31619 [Trichonephila clavipes]